VTHRRPTTRGIRKGLTQERVVDAAWHIVNAEGVDVLTMRRLGAELGVAAMAVYNHFEDRDSVLNALAERAMKLPPPPKASTRWRVRLEQMIEGIRRLASEHPHIYALAMSRPTKPMAAFDLMSQALAALRDAGLDDQAAAAWYHTLLLLIHGFPVWSAAVSNGCSLPPSNTDPQSNRDWELVHQTSPDAQFRWAMARVLDAIEAAAKQRNTPRPRRTRSNTKPDRRVS
jgi:AcrR family transcriptional regulator